METNQLQQLFFQQIKSKLPAHLSLVDDVAELLGISNDSSYRRIRGEKSISLDEMGKLADHYKVSVDQLLHLQTDAGTFTGKYITASDFDFEKYLEQVLADLKNIAAFKQKEVIWLSKDIPVFHYFNFPELASFKYFFWMKTLLQFPQFAHTPFSFDVLMKPLVDIGLKISNAYNSIPGAEIMSIENINTTLRQIEYFKETYVFQSAADLEVIYKQLHEMTDHLASMAEEGAKFLPGYQPNSQSAEFKMYVNDFIIGDNSSIATLDGNRISFIVHGHLNYLVISDPRFTAYHHDFAQKIIKKSILISGVGEKYSTRFFYFIHDRIEQCRNNKLQTIGKL
jgi:hypothetical protein